MMRNGKDERWNWLSMNMIVTNYDPEQNIIELIGINYDITELKETEAELVIAVMKHRQWIVLRVHSLLI